jgi:drug/metabolite transporter (DMT)-like permease
MTSVLLTSFSEHDPALQIESIISVSLMHPILRRLAIPLMLLSGTCATVIQKFMLEQRGSGRDLYPPHKFSKPWYLTLVMFIAEVCAMIFYFISRAFVTPSEQVVKTILDDAPQMPKHSNLLLYLLLGIPAVCDLLGTALMSIGLLYLSASVWQMLRGALTVFSALLHAFVLKRPQRNFMWAGVILVTLALVIVGFAAVTANGIGTSDVSSGLVILAIVLTVVAQLFRAVQVIAEDYFVHDAEISSYLIVGVEGMWGLVLTIAVFLPICQNVGNLNDEGNGVHEDSLDTITMLGNFPTLIGLSVGYLVGILGLNVCGMLVTEITNAVLRTIVESMRTMCVWLAQLILYYALKNTDYGHKHPTIGEKWTVSSFMELSGFLLLVTGMFVYNRSIELWFLKYDEGAGIPEDKEPSGI